MRVDAMNYALRSALVPGTVDEIWRKHLLLCPYDDERCSCVENMVEAFVSELESWDEKLGEAKKETDAAENKAVEMEQKLDEANEKTQELEAELDEARKLSDVDLKTEAISLGRREMEKFVLGRLSSAMSGPAKDLRREVAALVSELLRNVNEGGSPR